MLHNKVVFRPCIDLHEGRVKQIVGGTLGSDSNGMRTHFISEQPSSYYAELYKKDGLRGGHVILLGPGNTVSAMEALRAYPGGLQVGGGITPSNAGSFLDAGASHVIVTSWIFREGSLDLPRLSEMVATVGKNRLVLDLSCRRKGPDYFVVMDRWQTFTDLKVNKETLELLCHFCDEFLVHGVDVEGLCQGIDETLVQRLAEDSPLPSTYAGGARGLEDLKRVTEASGNRVDLTIGSALDIFGGEGVRYEDAVEFNRRVPGSPWIPRP